MEFDKKIEGKSFPSDKKLTRTEINGRRRSLEKQKQELIKTVKTNFNARMRALDDLLEQDKKDMEIVAQVLGKQPEGSKRRN